MKTLITALSLTLALSACSGSDDKKSGSGTGGGGQGQTACGTPLTVDHTSGGCRIRLVTPGQCSTVDVSGENIYEFAWTTDGTNCELPYTIYVAGHPASVTQNEDGSVTLENVFTTKINRSDFVSNTGGVIRVNRETFEGLGITSDNGTYQWQVDSFYKSGPGSNIFRLVK
jgi:hypothetical protein